MAFFAARAVTKSSAALPIPSWGPTSTRAATGTNAERYSASVSRCSRGYSPPMADGTSITRCSGMKMSSATRQLLPEDRIPATNQVPPAPCLHAG